jgi:hypothetical protein
VQRIPDRVVIQQPRVRQRSVLEQSVVEPAPHTQLSQYAEDEIDGAVGTGIPDQQGEVRLPRQHSHEFRRHLDARSTTGLEFYAARSDDQSDGELISVLRRQSDTPSASPGLNSNQGRNPINPTLSPAGDLFPASTVNRLRTRSPHSQDDELPLNPATKMQDELSLDEDKELAADDSSKRKSEKQSPLDKSCQEFREQLLNTSILDIAMDISPPGKTELFGDNVYRVWRDQYGNELAQGTIADLRRGYVIINASNGGQVRLPYARLSDSDWLAISEFWNLPVECGLGLGKHNPRCWIPQTATWHASALCHKPLYFENIQLERYGHSHGPFLQPIASGVHFFGKLFFLPYNTAINPPNECQYALGHYRPGNCAPWLRDPFPFSWGGAARQSLIYTGVGFLAD